MSAGARQRVRDKNVEDLTKEEAAALSELMYCLKQGGAVIAAGQEEVEVGQLAHSTWVIDENHELAKMLFRLMDTLALKGLTDDMPPPDSEIGHVVLEWKEAAASGSARELKVLAPYNVCMDSHDEGGGDAAASSEVGAVSGRKLYIKLRRLAWADGNYKATAKVIVTKDRKASQTKRTAAFADAAGRMTRLRRATENRGADGTAHRASDCCKTCQPP